MLLLRANTLALGHSGCRPVVVDRLLAFLERGLHPVVPEQGSVGASGDLAPLAHLALPLIGRGQVELGGQVLPALLALREVGVEPLRLEAKEGLALLNGTQMMSAIGALLLDADRLVRTASVAAAMSVEALLGTDVAYAAAYQLARPHPGQVAVAAELRHLLRDSGLQAEPPRLGAQGPGPYSLRCVPQVHGAVRDALDHLRRVLDIELNSATDNPLVFPGGGVAEADTVATGGGRVISGGNFHGEPIALALDFAKLALAELGSISERRTALLVDPRLNGGLPAFLVPSSGIDSGMMVYQYTAAALVSENKVLAHPASADSIPTSANQEDHVSMGSIAARHARQVLEHVERILSIELVVAAQALDLRLDALASASGHAAPSPNRGSACVRHIAGSVPGRRPSRRSGARTGSGYARGWAALPARSRAIGSTPYAYYSVRGDRRAPCAELGRVLGACGRRFSVEAHTGWTDEHDPVRGEVKRRGCTTASSWCARGSTGRTARPASTTPPAALRGLSRVARRRDTPLIASDGAEAPPVRVERAVIVPAAAAWTPLSGLGSRAPAACCRSARRRAVVYQPTLHQRFVDLVGVRRLLAAPRAIPGTPGRRGAISPIDHPRWRPTWSTLPDGLAGGRSGAAGSIAFPVTGRPRRGGSPVVWRGCDGRGDAARAAPARRPADRKMPSSRS